MVLKSAHPVISIRTVVMDKVEELMLTRAYIHAMADDVIAAKVIVTYSRLHWLPGELFGRSRGTLRF